MKLNKLTYIAGATIFLLSSCNSEDPFDGVGTNGEGRILSSSIELEVKSEDFTTRAVSTPSASDFTIDFYSHPSNTGDNPVASYLFSDMPEVLTLPVGEYIAQATFGGDYGEGKTAAFGTPYYKGESQVFTITENQILDTLEPIVCMPANVKVAVFFDESLVEVMSPDSYVSVKVGQSGVLEFTKDTNEDGYFAFSDGSTTLAATFTGMVEGVTTSETKTYDGVKPGLFYRVTFKIHSINPNDPTYPGGDDPSKPGEEDPGHDTPGGDEPGIDEPNDPTISGDITTSDSQEKGFFVDASVSFREVYDDTGFSGNIEGSEYLIDDMRPGYEGPVDDDPSQDDPGWENPGTNHPGNDPGNNPGGEPGIEDPVQPSHSAPAVQGVNGTSESSTNPSSFNVLVTSESEKGFTEFIVDIDSDALTPSELQTVGLTDHIDLINPGSLADAIHGLGFPIKDEVKGKRSVSISIDPQFLELLKVFKGSTNNFIFTVSDEYGTTKKTFTIKY